MAFFDDIGKKLTDVSQQTVKKTRDMADTFKYNSMISDEEKNIKNYFMALGEQYYKENSDQTDGEFSPLISKINESYSHISDYKKAIEKLSSDLKCPKCGASITSDDIFCLVCGTYLKDNPAVEGNNISNEIICSNCGTALSSEAEFCSNCGTKL